MTETAKMAIEKIKNELNGFKSYSRKGSAVSGFVEKALMEFAEQNDEFAQSIVQSDKKAYDCIEYTVEKSGSAISDLDICKKAAEFYFKGAKVNFIMQIDLGDGIKSNVSEPVEEMPETEPKEDKNNNIQLSLDDLLDF